MSKGNGKHQVLSRKPMLYDVSGKPIQPSQATPKSVHFRDTQWRLTVFDEDTIVAAHPARPPIVMNKGGHILQLYPDGTAIELVVPDEPNSPEDIYPPETRTQQDEEL